MVMEPEYLAEEVIDSTPESSSDKVIGSLRYIGDYTTQLYIIVRQYKVPY